MLPILFEPPVFKGNTMGLDLSFYRSLLENKRDEIMGMLQAAKDSVKPVALDQASVGRLSRMDALQAQAMSLAVERRRKEELNLISSALKRMEDGEYGYCITCGELIAPRRLEFNPTVLTCVVCAGKNG